MRPQLHRAILRRFLLRLVGSIFCLWGCWSLFMAQPVNELGNGAPFFLLMGALLLLGPTLLPRIQRLRMRLSVSRSY